MNIPKIPTVLAIAATAVGLGVGVGAADATPGRYTPGGDVRVIVAVDDGSCATITWPKGTTSTTCDSESVVQNAITTGDKFGASVVSSSGGVACRIVDITTGDTVYQETAGVGRTANCLRNAN